MAMFVFGVLLPVSLIGALASRAREKSPAIRVRAMCCLALVAYEKVYKLGSLLSDLYCTCIHLTFPYILHTILIRTAFTPR